MDVKTDHHEQLQELETQYQQHALHHDQELHPYYTTTDGTPITEETLYVNQIPHWHYQKAVDTYNKLLDSTILDSIENMIDQLAETVQHEPDRELDYLTDGGTRTQYYWVGDQGILYHTQTGDDTVIPFFDTIGDADRFIELKADENGKDNYSGMVLRKTGNQKVKEAVEVLTDQSGIEDFF